MSTPVNMNKSLTSNGSPSTNGRSSPSSFGGRGRLIQQRRQEAEQFAVGLRVGSHKEKLTESVQPSTSASETENELKVKVVRDAPRPLIRNGFDEMVDNYRKKYKWVSNKNTAPKK